MLAVVDSARVRADDGLAAWPESFNEMYVQVAGAFGKPARRPGECSSAAGGGYGGASIHAFGNGGSAGTFISAGLAVAGEAEGWQRLGGGSAAGRRGGGVVADQQPPGSC